MRSARSADALLLQPAPAAARRQQRTRPQPLNPTSCDAGAAPVDQRAASAVISEARARSPVALPAASKATASTAPRPTASFKSTASEGALRSLAMDCELDELFVNDAPPQRTASNASLAPSEAEENRDFEEDDSDAEFPPPPAASGRGHAKVALTSPRSAPIAVHRPAAGSMPSLRSSFTTFNWRARAPDAAADALSGGAFMPPQWRGDAADGDSEDDSGAGDGGASLLSSSLPPLRALALRDRILRRTGFIESEASPPASAPSRG